MVLMLCSVEVIGRKLGTISLNPVECCLLHDIHAFRLLLVPAVSFQSKVQQVRAFFLNNSTSFIMVDAQESMSTSYTLSFTIYMFVFPYEQKWDAMYVLTYVYQACRLAKRNLSKLLYIWWTYVFRERQSSPVGLCTSSEFLFSKEAALSMDLL